jgi:hypothetical protein
MKKFYLFVTFFLIGIFINVKGQVAPTNFQFVTETPPEFSFNINGWGNNYNAGTNFNVVFGRQNASTAGTNRIMTQFQIGTLQYFPITFPNGDIYDRVVVNRVANAEESDLDKQTLFFETGGTGGGNTIYFIPEYTRIVEAINRRTANRGSDNVFSNTGSETINNVERIDLMFTGGVFTPIVEESGFLISERGGNDPIKVAAITSLDGNGNVATLGSLVNINNNSHWGNTGISVETTVFQKRSVDAELRPAQNLTAQNICGVYVTFEDLGIENNETIYGISVFPDDVNASMDLIGLSNVPQNTNGSGAGGLDMMGGGGFFVSENVVGVDLMVNLSFEEPVAREGDVITLNITVDNNGPFFDNNVNSITTIPNGYNIVGLVPGYQGTSSITGNQVSWNLNQLNPGETRVLQVRVEVLPTGNRLFQSSVSGFREDFVPSNNNDEILGTISVGPIVANNDDYSAFPVNAETGGAPGNILDNDLLNDNPINFNDVNIEIVFNDGLPGIIIDNDGTFNVPPGSLDGTYNVEYRICEIASPFNCDNAIVTVVVDAGNCPDPLDETILSLNPRACGDPNGEIEVTFPLGAGFEYNINGGTFQSSPIFTGLSFGNYFVRVRVVASGCIGPPTSATLIPAICAIDDNFPPVQTSGGTVGNVLTNDEINGSVLTNLGDLDGAPTVIDNGGLTGVSISSNGTVNIPNGTPRGVYEVEYEICLSADNTVCDRAIATITVIDIQANNDNFTGTPINGYIGGITASVHTQNQDFLNGLPVNNNDITTTLVNNGGLTGASINNAGVITVPAGTVAGTYVLTYRICETAASFVNCDEATATILVNPPVIVANDDAAGAQFTGVTNVLNIFDNDLLNGVDVIPSEVFLSIFIPDPTSTIILNADGSVDISEDGVGGNQQLTYRICEILNPTNCDEAVVSATVTQLIQAVNDTYGPIDGTTGNPNIGNVISNDLLLGNPVDISDITIEVITPGTPVSGAPVPIINTTTGVVSVPEGTFPTSYQLVYEICEIADPTVCDQATVTVNVEGGFCPPSGEPTVARVQQVQGDIANNTSLSFPSQPAEGNLLVAISMHRNDGDNPPTGVSSASGAWTSAGTITIFTTNDAQANNNHRRGLTYWYRIAGANEAQAVTINWNEGVNNRFILQEFSTDLGEFVFEDANLVVPADGVQNLNTLNLGTISGLNDNRHYLTIAALGSRDGSGNITSWASDSENLGNSFGESNARSLWTGFAVETGITEKNVTANWQNNVKPIGAFAVFRIASIPSAGTPPAAPTVSITQPNCATTTGAIQVTSPAADADRDFSVNQTDFQASVNFTGLAPNTNYPVVVREISSGCFSAATFANLLPVVCANDDFAGPINGFNGANNILNVIANDDFNGGGPGSLNFANFSMTIITPATPIGANPVPSINVADARISVPPATPAGTYTITYQICEDANPTNCDQAVATIEVAAPPIVANDDILGTFSISGTNNAGNVLTNDSFNSGQATVGNVSISVDPSESDVITLNTTTGQVSVEPNSPAGVHTLDYEICDQLNPTNCSTATIEVEIQQGVTFDTDLSPGCLCRNDAPWLVYNISVNYAPAPANGSPLTIRFLDSDDRTLITTITTEFRNNQRDSILWPGASVDAEGNGNNWPGWVDEGEGWFEDLTQNFGNTRPSSFIQFQLNPESEEILVEYPLADAECAAEPTSFLLPVTWLSFNGRTERGGNYLTWSTASELNNDYFEVQRSIDGQNFEVIGYVQGNGTTSMQSNYAFIDKEPSVGYNYYRLRQVDFDGTDDFSRTIVINTTGEGFGSLKVFPNPTSGLVVIDRGDQEIGEIILKDAAGRVLRSERIMQKTARIDLSTFESGIYFLSDAFGSTVKIIKQ